MTDNFATEAQDCLSLAYKYNSLIDCVQSQRPGLLLDPELSFMLKQRDALERMFEQRVNKLAYQPDSDR